jgi:hypothetical protein
MSPEEIEFWREVESLIVPPIETIIEYRLHYDATGDIVTASMAYHPESTQYIVVDKNEYERYFEYRVVNGQLKKIDRDAGFNVKLHKNNTGFQVVKGHAGIILDAGETYTNTEYYDTTNR